VNAKYVGQTGGTLSETRELPIPSDTTIAEQSVEVLRAWIIDQGLQCSILPTAFEDPRAWGILLADVARHIGNALRDASGRDPGKTVQKIRLMFNTELSEPTDEPHGAFVKDR
jgi:uncharacterized protein DUF5076